jgi:hypothetical protein
MDSVTAGEQSTVSVRRSRNHGDALHGHPHDISAVRVTASGSGRDLFLVLAIISTAIAATLDKPVAGSAYGSLAVPLAGGSCWRRPRPALAPPQERT